MKILVLGKNGQVGFDLIHLLENRKIEYVALDRNDVNLAEIESIKNLLAKYEFDVLVNCAAYTKVDLAETEVELATKINALAVGEMAKACKEKSAKLVHISTDYVFAGDKSSSYLETDKTDPQSVYGMSKLQGEELALNLNDKTWVLRTAWVYGESGSNFAKTIAGLLKQGKELNVVDDQIGAPTWSKNIAKAILDLIENSPDYGIFNCTNQGETSWFEFAQEIAKTLNLEVKKIKPEKSTNINRPATRPSYSVLSNSKWIKAGLPPLPNWKDAWQEAQSSVLKNL
jgi:dTDP-4-dehydrorhamnose reductase